MLCQVQTAYIEIFDLSVFPIFTDIIIRRSKGKKSPAVYDLPFQLPNIYLLRWSRWLLLPGVVGLVIFFSDRNLWWRVAWALLLYFAACCLLQNKFSGDQYIDDDTADEGTVSFQLWQAMINNIVKRSFHTIDSHKIETDKLSVLPSFFVHDEVKKHPATSFARCWPLWQLLWRGLKPLLSFWLIALPSFIVFLWNLNFMSRSSDKFTQKFENLRVDCCVGSHRPYGCS